MMDLIRKEDKKRVQIEVPSGPLGILLDNNFNTGAVLKGFAPLPDGKKGLIELDDRIHPGFFLTAVDSQNLEGKSLEFIGKVLRDRKGEVNLFEFTSPGEERLVHVSKVVEISHPPGPLGLLLNSSYPNSAIVQGFAPLPSGEMGQLQKSGRIVPGSRLMSINRTDVSSLQLRDVGRLLTETSGMDRTFVFHLPSPNANKFSRPRNLSKSQASTVSSMVTGTLSSTVSLVSSGVTNSLTLMSSGVQMGSNMIQGVAGALTLGEDVEQRRMQELQSIRKYDRTCIDRGECWFMIDIAWITRWALFVTKKGPCPGPVTNHNLLKDGWKERLSGKATGRYDEPKDGLQRMIHYRGVCPLIWCMFAELHGAGASPPIARFALDIYEESVATKEMKQILESPRLKAGLLVKRIKEQSRRGRKKLVSGLGSINDQGEKDDQPLLHRNYGSSLCCPCLGF